MIILDVREPMSVNVEALLEVKSKDVCTAVLPSGDVLLAPGPITEWNLENFEQLAQVGILIERKTAGDFLSSIADGRLWDQAQRMSQVCPRATIVILGALLDKNGLIQVQRRITQWPTWSVRMAIWRLQQAGVAVLQVGDRDWADVVSYLHKWLFKKHKPHLIRKIADPLIPLPKQQTPSIEEDIKDLYG